MTKRQNDKMTKRQKSQIKNKTKYNTKRQQDNETMRQQDKKVRYLIKSKTMRYCYPGDISHKICNYDIS